VSRRSRAKRKARRRAHEQRVGAEVPASATPNLDKWRAQLAEDRARTSDPATARSTT
jgi:hypothetical protein